MSNPEKRDERSMSDILASIRKIMAQEPAGLQPPSLTRTPLNGVSGAGLDLPLGPELKLPPTRSEPAPSAVEAVSLDELLADSPLAAPPSAKGPTLVPVSPPSQAGAALEVPRPAKDAPAPAMDGAASPNFGPKHGDLGSVVPSKRDIPAPTPDAKDERSALGPPIPGPLLGEPARVPPAAEPLPEVPGADALRRLIAGVIPPSAHPSIAPARVPEPTKLEVKPATPAPAVAEKVVPAPKPAPEIKAEPKASAPVSVPAPTPAPAASVPKPVPTSSVPTRAAKLETAPSPAAATLNPVSAVSASGKTMDETVSELLRPLLREWLDKNMSRLIEPALKAELDALRSELSKDKKG